MSLNVPGIRRFTNPYKGFAKQRPGFAKCGWSEAWEPLGELAERNPGAAEWRRSVYRLLCAVGGWFQFYFTFFLVPFFFSFILEYSFQIVTIFKL